MTLDKIWEFQTDRFKVVMTAEDEDFIDLTWDETGEVWEQIDRGDFVVFQAKCAVYLDGQEIGTDYLGQCIYRDFQSFRTDSGYFRDMVSEAVREARQHIASIQTMHLRAA